MGFGARCRVTSISCIPCPAGLGRLPVFGHAGFGPVSWGFVVLIAVLALLGVDLVVLVALAVFLASRKRWVKRQPGAFRGAIRVSRGEVRGLKSKWKRGYGHWVRDVLVWTRAPLLFRNELLATDELVGQRPAGPKEVRRLGEGPVVIGLRVAGNAVEVAAPADDAELLPGPYSSATAHGRDASDQSDIDRSGENP